LLPGSLLSAGKVCASNSSLSAAMSCCIWVTLKCARDFVSFYPSTEGRGLTEWRLDLLDERPHDIVTMPDDPL
jgi:hypothetical protein